MHRHDPDRIVAESSSALVLSDPPSPEDFDTIHGAVLETARGRWFLQEYGRRNRAADTNVLLTALARIESALGAGMAGLPAPLPDLQLLELRDAIALTKDNLGALGPKSRAAVNGTDFSRLTAAVTDVVARLRATFERLQETAWTLRDREPGNPLCEILDTQARELARTCGLLDEIASGAGVIAALLEEVEGRVGSMIAQAGLRQAEPPQARSFEREPAPPPAATMAEPVAAAEIAPPEHAEAPATEPAQSQLPPFDADYERVMSETVDAALLSEDTFLADDEGALWQLPDEPPPATEPPQALAGEISPEESFAAPVEAIPPQLPQEQLITDPDLSDDTFEALSADAAVLPPPATGESPESPQPAWIDALAPAVRSARPGNLPFEEIEFPLAQDPAAAPAIKAELPKLLPNIAALERAGEAATASSQTRQDAQPHLMLFADDEHHPELPAAAAEPAPARPIDPLAPIMALSDEERIALFS